MIQIVRKEDCCGCEACRQVCPKQCIQMKTDNEGFRYPQVDTALCIDCHLCEKVCPVINQGAVQNPAATYAATNTDDQEKRNSSSGGVFFALSKYVINHGGVVFGVKFDENWQTIHSWTDNINGIREFQGSKYLQSRIEDSFVHAAKFLKEGRKVLFSGTPCQIAGLRLFLRKDYGEQLLMVEVACHGVPSPSVWSAYLTHQAKGNVISGISFRDKRNGWDKYGMKIDFANAQQFFQPMPQNLFMQGFLRDIYLRPSCSACPAKNGKSGADIMLADFWGIQKFYPELYAKGYYSLLLARSAHGKQIIDSLCGITATEVDYDTAIMANPAIIRSVNRPKITEHFWQKFPSEGVDAIADAIRRTNPTLTKRIIRKIIKALKK